MNQFRVTRCTLVMGLLAAALLLRLSLFGQSNFQFAFLSDTHIGSPTGEADLRASVRDLNANTNLSFVILSGDVTEYGSRGQLELAHAILKEIKIPLHIIPGNHDTKWSESGATDFPQLFGADRFNFEFGGLRFIGLHEGPLMKMGDGFWSPQDVRWLKETLAHLADKRQPLVFITHYPLNDGIANWFEVLDLLKQYNTQVVLHGHGHANRTYNYEGVPGVMGRSNLRAREAVGGFNLVTVTDGRMVFAEHHPERKTLQPWTEVKLGSRDYASDTNAYPRPDFSVNLRYPSVRPKWEFNVGYTIAASPAVWNKTALAGDAAGVVRGFDLESGAVKWQFKARNAAYSTPEVKGNRVVFASVDGNVYALNPADGAELWRFETQRSIVASPRIANGLVYIGSSEGVFRALDLASGKQVWEFRGLTGFVETRPLVAGGKVVFGAWDGHLYALDAQTGTLAWKWHADRPGNLFSPAACWPVAAAGKVFIVAPDRKMSALDLKSGEQIWRTGEYMVRESIGLSEDGQRFYIRAMKDYICAFSTTSDQPNKLWETDSGFGYDINSAMLMEREGTLFYGTKNGMILALDGKTGTLKWQHKIGCGVVNTVLPLNGDEVLATDFSGRVVRLGAR